MLEFAIFLLPQVDDRVQTFTAYFFKNLFNIINAHTCTFYFSDCPNLFEYNWYSSAISPFTLYMLFILLSPYLLDFILIILKIVHCISLHYCIFLKAPVPCSILSPSIPLSTLPQNILNKQSLLTIRDHHVSRTPNNSYVNYSSVHFNFDAFLDTSLILNHSNPLIQQTIIIALAFIFQIPYVFWMINAVFIKE